MFDNTYRATDVEKWRDVHVLDPYAVFPVDGRGLNDPSPLCRHLSASLDIDRLKVQP